VERLRSTMAAHAASGTTPGLSWGIARHGEVRTGAAGVRALGGPAAEVGDRYRIASMTKPIVAVLAMVLLEECRLRLDDPVDDLLPELAGRRVLARPDGPLDDTVPAARPITVRDVLTFRLGWGMDFTAFGVRAQPVLDAMDALGLGAGAPAPSGPPAPDEWLRRLGTLPLSHQPGERWLYNTGADVLGALVGRATGTTLDRALAERLLDPLGLRDTSFWVAPQDRARFGPCYRGGIVPGSERTVYDDADGQWAAPPAFPSGAAGLVSTVDDVLVLGRLLAAQGTFDGMRLLSRPTVGLMATDALTEAQRTTSGPDPSGAVGWGLGVAVQVRRTGLRTAGSFGWDGGLGSSWWIDPAEDLVGVLLTNQSWDSPSPPAVVRDFWTSAYAALA
jgi:CubicO group peptidase (beta-lactamase class C family)